ncbi:MAG: GNAT family N-acetyltransferase [Candidatus Promineifilaceae bacterium]|nr:GNAT family N-acetyltransferase [Candidatus Promineifilaceae bacterium]
MNNSTIPLSREPLRIQGERLYLRDLQLRDLNAVLKLRGDPLVAAGLGIEPASEDESRTWLHRAVRNNALIPRYIFQLGVFSKRKGQFVGWVQLGRATPPFGEDPRGGAPRGSGWYELRYAMLQEWWGQGLATEAVRCVTGFAFRRLAADALFADILPENLASGRVLQKVAMEPVRETASGCIRYLLVRDAWQARRGEAV